MLSFSHRRLGRWVRVRRLTRIYPRTFRMATRQAPETNRRGRNSSRPLTTPLSPLRSLNRLSTSSSCRHVIASRVAHELSLPSSHVSYQIRYDATVSLSTIIKFMTDGVLLRELVSDFLHSKYLVLTIDEAHERSMNTDMLIGVVSRVVDFLGYYIFRTSNNERMSSETPQECVCVKLISTSGLTEQCHNLRSRVYDNRTRIQVAHFLFVRHIPQPELHVHCVLSLWSLWSSFFPRGDLLMALA